MSITRRQRVPLTRASPRFAAPRRVLAVLPALLFLQAAGAAVMHVQVEKRAGIEFGAGYSVGKDTECFIVTPLHVVQYASNDGITVTDPEGRSARARVIKESQDFDAALLRVTDSTALECPADWTDGSGTTEAIGSAPFLVSRKIDDNGRVMQTRLFASSTSRERIELQPYGTGDQLREGDSGSSLYAGSRLVGMITAVDTKSGQAVALTQSQIHGLFGSDVLPSDVRKVLLLPFTYRRQENAYATIAAREFFVESAGMQVLSGSAGADVPTGTDYVVAGEILQIGSRQAANPDYQRPDTRRDDSDSLGQRLFRSLGKKLESEVDEAMDRNRDARYLRTYNVDVRVDVQETADGNRISNLEQLSFVFPVANGADYNEMQNTAVRNAVRQALTSTLDKYPLR